MSSRAQWWLAVGTLTCLISFPHTVTFSSSFREEAVAYRLAGYERQQQGDREGALAAYQKAAALDPSYPTPLNDAGVLLEGMGRLEDAKLAYERALAIDPNYLEAHSNLAMAHERLGEREKAIFHWLKRYQLGDPEEAWTARAEERLAALGVLESYPGLKGKIYTRRHVVQQELKAHEQSVKEFQATTELFGRW
ncbi:MAG: tetratricopeptide repeat protein [Candidatus Omnitrophica bacterium]|nr:tetratricopeptide repeat protein [Candidatus Omnitrophota bacterium]